MRQCILKSNTFQNFHSLFFLSFLFQSFYCRNNVACLPTQYQKIKIISLFFSSLCIARDGCAVPFAHAHLFIFIFFSIHFKLRRCACERHRIHSILSHSIPPPSLSIFLFHSLHHPLWAAAAVYLLSVVCRSRAKNKKKQIQTWLSCIQWICMQLQTHFTFSFISNIEATYQSVPCLLFLDCCESGYRCWHAQSQKISQS